MTREKRKLLSQLVKKLNGWYEANDNVYISININIDTYAEGLRHNLTCKLYDEIMLLCGKKVGKKLLHTVSYQGHINADDIYNILGFDYVLDTSKLLSEK